MKQFLLFIMLLQAINTFAQDGDCENFKAGKFKYEDPSYGIITVKRTNDYQVEITKDRIEIYSSIQWLSDCKFVITYKKTKGANLSELIGKKIYVQILEGDEDGYICRTTDEKGFGGRLKVIKVK